MSHLEPGRPETDWYCHIMIDGLVIAKLPGHVLQDVYDIAINSMDMGSGFLSTEEVGNLRKLGDAIGAERFDYQHDKCLRCGHTHTQHNYGQPRACRTWTYPYDEPKCTCEGFVRPE